MVSWPRMNVAKEGKDKMSSCALQIGLNTLSRLPGVFLEDCCINYKLTFFEGQI